MANTYVDYTGDGSETDFNFSFPYIKTSHVVVETNDGPAGGTNRWVRTTDFTVQTSPTTLVRLNSAPANLVKVRVLRDSDANTSIVDFANGSVLTETELDNAYLHNRYLAEEAEEGVSGGTISKNDDGQFNADGLRLENLADPESNDDAVNKGYADGRYVDEAGDTMTGNLDMGSNEVTSSAVPSGNNSLTNKSYVDGEVATEASARITGDSEQVTRTGDSMSGDLTMTSPAKVVQATAPTTANDLTNKGYVDGVVAAGDALKVNKTGDTMTGDLTLPAADPSSDNHATRKRYVDQQIAVAVSSGTPGGPIDTANISDGAVTTAKIEDDAVTAAKLDHTAVTPGSYTNTDITVDENGRITAASNGSSGAGATNLSNTPAASSVEIESSTGTNTTVAGATTSLAGVMTGADKTKLNGIEAGATADQTASEILTAVKTVDGAASGLDADLLDGQHASAFAASSHTHTAADITDFDTEVANNSAVTANTAKVSNATHTGEVTGSTALTIAGGAVTHDKISTTDSVFKINSSDQVRFGGDLQETTLQSISQFGITSSSASAVATIESTATADAVLVIRAPGEAIVQLRDTNTVGTNNGKYNVGSGSGALFFGSINDDDSARVTMCNMFPKGTTSPGGVFQIEPITNAALTATEAGFTAEAGMIAYVSDGNSGNPCLKVHDGSSFQTVGLGTSSVSKYASSWFNDTTGLANGGTYSFTHNLGTNEAQVQIWMATTSAGANLKLVPSDTDGTDNRGASITALSTTSVTVQLTNDGWTHLNSDGSRTVGNWGTTYTHIKVVVIG